MQSAVVIDVGSVQFKMVYIRMETHALCDLPHHDVSKVSPALPLQRKVVRCFLFLCLSSPDDQGVMALGLCFQVVSQAFQHF